MATYVALIDLTREGVRNFRQTHKRADAFIEMAKKAGVKVTAQYWTLGDHDGVLIFEAPDDAAAAAVLLDLGSEGNVRTKTLRAFGRNEIDEVIAKAP
jgi:uncharacterized protein with GYD domain